MDWTELEMDGRVTALRRGLCAGVGNDGRAFTCDLAAPVPSPVAYDEIVLDSFGVVGASPGDGAWLTGRGADGRLHLFGVHPEPAGTGEQSVAHSLEGIGAMWAAPVLDTRAAHLLASDLQEGTWRLRAYPLNAAIAGGSARGRGFALGSEPGTSLAFSFYEKGPLVVAGRIGDGPSPAAAAWTLADLDSEPAAARDDGWRRVHLAPSPTELTSVAVGQGSGRIWLAGRVDARPVAWEVLQLPFRGLVRSAAVTMPRLELAPESFEASSGRAVVLVEEAPGDQPVFVAATTRGNRLCWHDGSEWKAIPAPDGRLEAACVSGGAVHLLLGASVWSVADPTGG
jgi:hypothetical protein